MLQSRLIMALVLGFSLTSMTGCATLFGNSKKTINVTSDPSGATVLLNGNQIGETPLAYRIPDDKMSHPGMLTIKKNGYEPTTMQISSKFQLIAILNLGIIVYWAIDYIAGNLYTLEKTQYDAKLQPSKGPNS